MRKQVLRMLAATTAVLAIGIGSNAAARANLLSVPLMIPDICVFGQCVQFTQATALASIQHVLSDIQMLDNMSQQISQMRINAQTMKGAWPQLQSDMTTLQTAYTTTLPGVGASAAADAYTKQETTDQAYIDALSPIVDSAQGSNQQAQLTNRYLEQVDGDVRKTGALQASQIKQHQDEETGSAVGVFGILNSAGPNSSQDLTL